MPPSPAAPAPAGGAPRDAAGAARREAVRAWNGARDLDEIPARVWARWRGAALARAGVRFAGGDGAGRPDFELAACAKVAHTDAARRWALTWRLCATAVAGSRVRVEFVATVVDADAARGAGPSLGTGAGGAGADGGWSGLVGALDDDGRGARPAGGAGAGARAVPRRRGELDAERVRRRPRRARRAESLPARAGDAGLRAWLARGGEAAGRALLLGLARALRPRAADLVDAQRREFAARPDLPPIGAEGDWAAVPALALHCVARACPRLPAEVAPWAERVGADVVRWCGEAPPDVRALATEAVGALGELQARGTRARPAPLADEFLGAAARAAAARHAATARGAVCALRGVALGLAPGAAAEVAALDALAPWVSAWLDAASRALAGDAAAAAACVEDAAAARYAVAACGDLWASVPRESADLARRATDALRAWTPAALAAAPAGVRAGLPVLALGRAAAAFYQTAAGRAALRDGDAAAVEARAREAGASNEDARAVRFALRGPARAAPPPGAPPTPRASARPSGPRPTRRGSRSTCARPPRTPTPSTRWRTTSRPSSARATTPTPPPSRACWSSRGSARRSSRAWTRRREAASRRSWRTRSAPTRRRRTRTAPRSTTSGGRGRCSARRRPRPRRNKYVRMHRRASRMRRWAF